MARYGRSSRMPESGFDQVAMTHVGCRRKLNEDALLANSEHGLWVVADGMGGHDAGEVASAMVVEALSQCSSAEQALTTLGDVNARLVEMARTSFDSRTVGSTVVGLVADANAFTCLWAGDSRAYRVRDHAIARLTRDHSLVQDLIDAGMIDEAAAEGQPNANVINLIGNTPLIRLRHASEQTGCEMLGKCEFLNPGQSVKDRAALFIIQDAVARGELRPGGVVVDGTAGNTGIGLAMVANALGMRTVIVIPETQTQEKKDTLRALGADLVEVPAVPYRNPNNYVKVSGRMAEKLAASEPNGAIWANQFDNIANRRAHLETTGPEICDQTGGKVDVFICAVRTGVTLG